MPQVPRPPQCDDVRTESSPTPGQPPGWPDTYSRYRFTLNSSAAARNVVSVDRNATIWREAGAGGLCARAPIFLPTFCPVYKPTYHHLSHTCTDLNHAIR